MNKSELQEFIKEPRESLNIELKRWLDPSSPEGIAKIVKGALALRNTNGGYLIVGFNNDPVSPDTENKPSDILGSFHQDIIQGLISKYSSDPFEVSVEFVEGVIMAHPVIIIPAGVRTPVAAKADLKKGEENLISVHDVYVRTLRANNTPSSAKIKYGDWQDLAERCFDNREADIGRFFRRHLSGLSKQSFADIISNLGEETGKRKSLEDNVQEFMKDSEERFQKILDERNLTLANLGEWQVSLVIDGEISALKPNVEFLNLLESSNPNYTGWPVWLNSRGFSDTASRPRVYNKIWESLIIDDAASGPFRFDFYRFDPTGRFFLKRILQDDTAQSKSIAPLTLLDPFLMTYRVIETLAVGLAFAKAMQYPLDTTKLGFGFKWTKLKDRELSPWANWERYVRKGRIAYQDEVFSYVEVPLDTPAKALSGYVVTVMNNLLEVFDGLSMEQNVAADLTDRLLTGRMV